jgi:hypothetical protein
MQEPLLQAPVAERQPRVAAYSSKAHVYSALPRAPGAVRAQATHILKRKGCMRGSAGMRLYDDASQTR